MRIIKFRALKDDMSDFRFVYGNLIYDNKNNPRIQEDRNEPTFTTCIKGTEGQFTGLHDKNGKEIYEGDIILFQTFSNWDDESMKRHKATVIFKEGCFMWEILKFGKKSVTYYANAKEPLRNTNSIWGLEVIGNIYENPELLTD